MSQGWPELILYPSGTEKLSGHGPGWYLRVPPNPLLALSCAPHPLKETPATDPRMRGRGEMLGPPDSLQVEPFGEGPQHLPSCKHPLFLNRSPPGALALPSSHPCTHGQVIWKSHASLLLSSRLPRLPKHFSEPGGHTQQQAEHTLQKLATPTVLPVPIRNRSREEISKGPVRRCSGDGLGRTARFLISNERDVSLLTLRSERDTRLVPVNWRLLNPNSNPPHSSFSSD